MAIEFVSDYFPLYLISSDGNIHSGYTKKDLKPFMRNGYKAVCLVDDGKKAFKNIHRLVAESFIPNKDNKPQVNHIDGNKLNNDVSNLEWSTASENIQHAHDGGLIPKLVHTERHKAKMAKMAKVWASKRVLCVDTGKEYSSAKEASECLGVAHSNICRVAKGQRGSANGMRFKYI